MTNEELQKIINIGDICVFSNYHEKYKFVGYEHCHWQGTPDCHKCKGNMKFVSNGLFVVGCHSYTKGYGNGKYGSDVTIVQKGTEFILTEELFEI